MRTIDMVGRFTIPKEIRDKYGLDSGIDIKIIDEENYIKLIPQNICYKISEEDMNTLRKIYSMLSESGILDEESNDALARITKRSNSKCEICGNYLFLNTDNSLKCYKCNE